MDSTVPVNESPVSYDMSGSTQQKKEQETTRAIRMVTQGAPARRGISSWTLDALSIACRFITCIAAWMAFYLTLTAKQTKMIHIGPIRISEHAKWQYASAFKFLLIANAIVASFTILTTLLAILIARTRSKPASIWWGLLLLDMGMSYVQMAAVAAALAVSLIGKNGNSHTNWEPICDMFSWFCDRMQWSLVAAAIAYFTLVEATILDVYNIYKSRMAPKSHVPLIAA